MNVSVPSQSPGQSSLPAEILLADNGLPVTGRTRLAIDRSPRRRAYAYGHEHAPGYLRHHSPAAGVNGIGDIIPAFQNRVGRYGMSGLGYTQTVCDPFGGNCQDVSQPDLWQTVEYPTYNPPVDYTGIVTGATKGIVDVIAVMQGGAITPTGAVYGNPAAATVAAGTPAASFSVGGQGAQATISPVMLLLGVGLTVLLIAKK